MWQREAEPSKPLERMNHHCGRGWPDTRSPPLRWYAISLLAPPLILICVAALYGRAPLRALGQNWSLIFTSFLSRLADHDLAQQCRRGDRLGGIRVRAVPRSSRPAPRSATHDGVLAVPCTELLRRNTIMDGHGDGVGATPAASPGQSLHRWLALQQRRLPAC